ncbi:MAG: sigma-70 family RNA polymerase sigma factor [Puia sp.]|nr:sigma-70 family RNA polymerase sigma factor [Puia sp.]
MEFLTHRPQEASFLASDNSMIAEFYLTQYANLVRRLYCKGMSKEDAQDIVSETFFKFFKHRSSLTSAKHAQAWLNKVAKNAAIDLFRERKKKRNVITIMAKTQDPSDWGIDNEDVEPPKCAEERHQSQILEVLKTISILTPRQRQVIEFLYLDRKSIGEIAAALNIKRQTVLNTKSDALKSLFKKIMVPEQTVFTTILQRQKRKRGPSKRYQKWTKEVIKNTTTGLAFTAPLSWTTSVRNARRDALFLPTLHQPPRVDYLT